MQAGTIAFRSTWGAGPGRDGYLRPMSAIPARTRRLARLIAWAVRLLAATWRVRRFGGRSLHGSLARGPVVAAFFHEDMLPMVALHRGLGFSGMASKSEDGELLAGVISSLGYGTVRGSSSHGGVNAALSALRSTLASGASIAIAVDGPRGPRQVVQPGAAALSALSGRPILLLRAHARPAWRAKSWDRFLLPLPFAKVELRYATLDAPPPGRVARAEATRGIHSELRALAGDEHALGAESSDSATGD